jgi:membrane-bound lytic murein transglycosylase A
MLRGALILLLLVACDRQADPGAPPISCPETAPAALPAQEQDELAGSTLTSTGDDALALTSAGFDDLPGWADDRHGEAIPAFLASCAKLAALDDDDPLGASASGGRARDWRAACAAAAKVPAGDHDAARRFFEAEFVPYAAAGEKKGARGKLTGYYVQTLRGSRTRQGAYQTPMFARPPDLVSVELSRFIADGRGRRIWGRVDPARATLVRYPSRAELRRAPIDEHAVLVWVDDPVDAIFAEIQGSGRVLLDDGGVMWLAFAGKNGHEFRGVGGILLEMGEIQRGQGTMQGVRAWFDAHPERVQEVADRNPAKVFFQISSRAGAIGTQDVILTPRRSMAVDRAVVALSTPVWVDTRAPVSPSGAVAPWRQLLIAQDTGGGILGAVRGDIYWGDDLDAAEIAGRMGGPGRMWLLLPRALAVAD